ncbi:hypothetical protein TNCV_3308951 [Trichonephila clavipes]|nr:hypothetical protein TNCV_3308951 [Trichonephila clavipes]
MLEPCADIRVMDQCRAGLTVLFLGILAAFGPNLISDGEIGVKRRCLFNARVCCIQIDLDNCSGKFVHEDENWSPKNDLEAANGLEKSRNILKIVIRCEIQILH